MGTFLQTIVRLIAPGSNASVSALDVRNQVSSRFLCSTKACRTICCVFFSVKKDEPVVVIKKEFTQLYSKGISSCVIGIVEVLLLTPVIHFSSERCMNQRKIRTQLFVTKVCQRDATYFTKYFTKLLTFIKTIF